MTRTILLRCRTCRGRGAVWSEEEHSWRPCAACTAGREEVPVTTGLFDWLRAAGSVPEMLERLEGAIAQADDEGRRARADGNPERALVLAVEAASLEAARDALAQVHRRGPEVVEALRVLYRVPLAPHSAGLIRR